MAVPPVSLKLRELGNTGLKLSCVGFGASPLGNVFGPVSGEDAIASVHEAFRCGINFFDTSPYMEFFFQLHDNLVENLSGDFEYEVQVPYLLYWNASQEVNGIWFYNPRECEDVANLFTRILNAYSKVPSKSKVSPSKSEFEELEAVPTMSVMEGPLEPSSTAIDAPDDSSFQSIFGVFGTPK